MELSTHNGVIFRGGEPIWIDRLGGSFNICQMDRNYVTNILVHNIILTRESYKPFLYLRLAKIKAEEANDSQYHHFG